MCELASDDRRGVSMCSWDGTRGLGGKARQGAPARFFVFWICAPVHWLRLGRVEGVCLQGAMCCLFFTCWKSRTEIV